MMKSFVLWWLLLSINFAWSSGQIKVGKLVVKIEDEFSERLTKMSKKSPKGIVNFRKGLRLATKGISWLNAKETVTSRAYADFKWEQFSKLFYDAASQNQHRNSVRESLAQYKKDNGKIKKHIQRQKRLKPLPIAEVTNVLTDASADHPLDLENINIEFATLPGGLFCVKKDVKNDIWVAVIPDTYNSLKGQMIPTKPTEEEICKVLLSIDIQAAQPLNPDFNLNSYLDQKFPKRTDRNRLLSVGDDGVDPKHALSTLTNFGFEPSPVALISDPNRHDDDGYDTVDNRQSPPLIPLSPSSPTKSKREGSSESDPNRHDDDGYDTVDNRQTPPLIPSSPSSPSSPTKSKREGSSESGKDMSFALPSGGNPRQSSSRPSGKDMSFALPGGGQIEAKALHRRRSF